LQYLEKNLNNFLDFFIMVPMGSPKVIKQGLRLWVLSLSSSFHPLLAASLSTFIFRICANFQAKKKDTRYNNMCI